MEALVLPMAEEVIETTTPPPKLEEDEFDVLAFELWQLGSCPEIESDQDCVDTEVWSHASCL